jgi:hypothetical protein
MPVMIEQELRGSHSRTERFGGLSCPVGIRTQYSLTRGLVATPTELTRLLQNVYSHLSAGVQMRRATHCHYKSPPNLDTFPTLSASPGGMAE